jgi:hypothetical protein
MNQVIIVKILSEGNVMHENKYLVGGTTPIERRRMARKKALEEYYAKNPELISMTMQTKVAQ